MPIQDSDVSGSVSWIERPWPPVSGPGDFIGSECMDLDLVLSCPSEVSEGAGIRPSVRSRRWWLKPDILTDVSSFSCDLS